MRPDLSILLRVGADTAASRRQERGGEPEHFEALDKQRRIATAYEAAVTRDDVGPVAIVDSETSFDEVAAELRRLVSELLRSARP